MTVLNTHPRSEGGGQCVTWRNRPTNTETSLQNRDLSFGMLVISAALAYMLALKNICFIPALRKAEHAR